MRKNWLIAAGWILLACLVSACTTKQAEDRQPRAEIIRNLGEAYLRDGSQQGQTDKCRLALKEFLKAESLYPDDYILQDDLGLTYYCLDKPDDAIRHFKRALELKSDYSPARNNLGNAYAAQKEWAKAIEQYKLVASDLLYMTPQYPLSNLGFAYFQMQNYELSEQYYLQALKNSPDYINALVGLAQTYLATDRVADAIVRLERAAKKYPQSAAVQFELGKAYSRKGDYRKAYDAYQSVVQLDQDSALSDRAQAEAEKIKHLQ